MRSPFFPVASALLAAVLALCGAGTARADETLRKVQQSLRDQGFYYGSIDGSPGDETTQAIKRYQIRNGLAVTGALNDETRNSIARTGGASTNATTPPAPPRTANAAPTPARQSISPRPAAPLATPPPLARDRAAANNEQPDYRLAPRAAAQPPATGRGNADDNRGDDEETTATAPASPYRAAQGRPDLRVYPPSSDSGANPPPPRYGAVPSPGLTDLFAQTPYEFAPPAVQGDVLRRAQSQLLRFGFYDGEADGAPGPQTSEAIANFQEVNRLRRSARLDINTLAAMRLLPGRRVSPPRYYAPRPQGVYEGRIVH